MKRNFLFSLLFLLLIPAALQAQYAGWKHSGSLFILTTPEGANLPASASESDFPIMVQLDKDNFDFGQAQANGEDIRFSSLDQKPLAYQIDEWNSRTGSARVWVKIPLIKGNEHQEIKLYWGKPDVASESSGKAVFNAANGYVGVWHMNESPVDEVNLLDTKDTGTTPTPGVIGAARHFTRGHGLFCGEKITTFPTGSHPQTTEAWLRPEKPNGTIVGWGNDAAQGKAVMQYRSPSHIKMDCFFSGADVTTRPIPASQWIHVVHTWQDGSSRVYVNGVVAGLSTHVGPPPNIKNPARMWIGGWYNNYDFVGDIDEVRVSSVARSADWVKLEYENQKPLQTLTGWVVQPGTAYSVSPARATVIEGKSETFVGEAGGAQKVYWVLKRDGQETIVATDRKSFTFQAGRVSGNQSLTLCFKAVYAGEVKTRDIPITVQEAIPDPVFTLQAPATWDGRSTIEVIPRVGNLLEMHAAGAGELHYSWNVADIAVTHEAAPGKLICTRAQNSGRLTITATLDNGGKTFSQSAEIIVTEPRQDPWLVRTPERDEKPEDNQFYARDDKNEGTLYYNGTSTDAADSVFLRVYADDQPYKEQTLKLSADGVYAFAVKLKPGLIKYRVEFGSRTADRDTVRNTVSNLICGDAYVIQGQSNAEANDFGRAVNPYTSDWIRSFGTMAGDPAAARNAAWGNAVSYDNHGAKLQIGYWGIELAKQLVENQKIPICILNGAVGGTRIDQHQRNPSDPQDVNTIYGRLLWRVRQAKLTNGIRGILWHQGENDQGADGPTGGYGWETYRQYFIDMAGAWKQDFPNIQNYYVFQIWPKSCSMGVNGSDNRLREVQRNLPTAFAHLSIMSTLGIDPPGTCHFPPAGYAQFARLIGPLVERDNYGRVDTVSITAPNLKRACWTSNERNEIVMDFDQPMKWADSLASQFYLDGDSGKALTGSVRGNTITLKLAATSTAQTLTYLDSKSWSQKTLLRGENGIAALTFHGVPILPSPPIP